MSADSGHLDLHALLHGTQVSTLTLTVVPLLSVEDTLSDAAKKMRSTSHGSALVCDGQQLVGIITERDLLTQITKQDAFKQKVTCCMTSAPQTLSVTDTLADAVRLMDRGGYRRLPVVDESGAPAGIVDVKTVVNFVVDQIPRTVYTQVDQKSLTVRHREGA